MKSNLPNSASITRLGPNEPCWCRSGKKYKKCHQSDDAEARRDPPASPRLHKGRVSPRRAVPEHIPRPEYAASGNPTRSSNGAPMFGERLERMRRACAAAARVLREAGTLVQPGVTTDTIDEFVHRRTIELGGYPSPLNYRGFPKSVCTSVNEVICHGIPDDRQLVDGDIVNLDVTVFLDGMHGDCNTTFSVGHIDRQSQQLVSVTRTCLELGIAAVKPGRPISDIGGAIEGHALRFGLGVVRSYCGHGIGETFHTNLQIPHYFDGRATTVMVPGLTFTIEPMICLGSPEEVLWDDDWTVVTKDFQRSAQFEHTVVVTDTAVEVLTVERDSG